LVILGGGRPIHEHQRQPYKGNFFEERARKHQKDEARRARYAAAVQFDLDEVQRNRIGQELG
jgi:hypothetical protein